MLGLKFARIRKNLTQQELADMIGVNKLMISRYELGNAKPSIDKLFRMADILGVTVEYLVKGE